jgi:hydroxyquinol 1,2-dioxygenase
MKAITESNITATVLKRLEKTSDPRLKKILAAAIRHLHDFVREVGLTPEEWKAGIDFLTGVGHITDDKRQEFILLSDTLGVSALVDLLKHAKAANGTASSLLGPFYVGGAPEREHGDSIAATPGEPIIVRGAVIGADGRPVQSAQLDVWQAAPNGLYDIQDRDQPEMNLRGKFRTDKAGRFEFRSVKPKSYPIPHDGPVGKLLRAQGRHPYRPAHIHFIITAKGYEPLTTALYIGGDQYIESDAVFGAKDALTVSYRKNGRATMPRQAREPEVIEFDFTLAPAEVRKARRRRALVRA